MLETLLRETSGRAWGMRKHPRASVCLWGAEKGHLWACRTRWLRRDPSPGSESPEWCVCVAPGMVWDAWVAASPRTALSCPCHTQRCLPSLLNAWCLRWLLGPAMSQFNSLNGRKLPAFLYGFVSWWFSSLKSAHKWMSDSWKHAETPEISRVL